MTDLVVRLPNQQRFLKDTEETRYWRNEEQKIRTFLEDTPGLRIRDGSQHVITLTGPNGIHKQNALADAFVWFGMPTISEVAKECSVSVGIQVLDTAAYIPIGSPHNQLSTERVKPNIFYMPDDMPNREKNIYSIILEQKKTLMHEGTINPVNDGLDKLAIVVRTPEELVSELHRQTPRKQSLHNGHNELPNIDPMLLRHGRHILRADIKEPEFRGIVYTSANPKQDEEAILNAEVLGEYFGNNNIGMIHGAGKTGLMGAVNRACVSQNGYSVGFQCPYIAGAEGIPDGMSILNMTPEIYSRMAGMYKRGGEFAVIGGGGRGGGGTYQEAIIGLLVTSIRSTEQKLGLSNIVHNKKIEVIFDNSRELWNNTISIFEYFGKEQGKDFHIANNNKEVFSSIENIKQRVYDLKIRNMVSGKENTNSRS